MRGAVCVFVLGMIFSSLFGQKPIKVKESSESFESGSHNALVVSIYGADKKDVEKAWKKVMKDYDGKVSTKKEVFADDAMIKAMSSNTIDIYAKIEEISDEELQLSVGFDLGGAYLSSSQHSSQYKVAEGIVYNFAVDMTKEAIRGQQKEAEKVLKTMEKDKEDLIKTNEGLHEDIEDYKKKIEQAEKAIETNVAQQAEKDKEIEAQNEEIKKIIEKEKAVK